MIQYKKIVFVFCIISGLILSACFSYAELVGAWSFDEGKGTDVIDSSKFKHHGIVTDPEWVDGKFGKALSFNADKKTVVEISDKDGAFTTQKFTIAAWIKSAKTNGNWMGLVGKWEAGNNTIRNYGLWLHQANGTLGLQCYGPPHMDVWPAAPNLCDNNWHHVAGTFDGAKAIAYVDGKKVADAAYASKLSTTLDPVRIGRGPWVTHYSTAIIDEVAIYNNALQEKEISDLMGKSLKSTAVEPKAKLAFAWAGIKNF